MVSGDNTQYRDIISDNWAGKIHMLDSTYNTKESWNWHYRAKNGDWCPMFGQPVTNIKKYTSADAYYKCVDEQCTETKFDHVENIRDVEMKRISSTDITEYDSILIFTTLTDQKSTVQAVYTDVNERGYASSWSLIENDDLDGDKAARITTQVETGQEYIVTEKGRLIEFGSNHYGMMGTGKETSEGGWKDEPLILKNNDRYQVKGVSLNKRSICALATDTESSDPSVPGLWCWGSSTFGQLGYDNHDNNFSYTDTSNAWTTEGANEYYDPLNRMQDTPVKVALKFSE